MCYEIVKFTGMVMKILVPSFGILIVPFDFNKGQINSNSLKSIWVIQNVFSSNKTKSLQLQFAASTWRYKMFPFTLVHPRSLVLHVAHILLLHKSFEKTTLNICKYLYKDLLNSWIKHNNDSATWFPVPLTQYRITWPAHEQVTQPYLYFQV